MYSFLKLVLFAVLSVLSAQLVPCLSYVIPQRMLIIGCGNLGSDVACHFKHAGTHITATTTNISNTKLYQYVDDVLLFNDDNKHKLKKTLSEIDHVFISVVPKEHNTYENIANNIAKYVENIPKRVHIAYISSVSAYGTITNGDEVDEYYNKSTIFNSRALDLLCAENIMQNLQSNGHSVSIFRPQALLSSKSANNDLSMVKWASGKRLPKTYGDAYMGVSHHDEIIKAYKWCLKKNIEGVININNPPFIRRTFFDTVCDKYKIPRPMWVDDKIQNVDNKRIVCKKLIDSGYEFLIPDVMNLR